MRIRINKKVGSFFFSKMGIGLWKLLSATFMVKDDDFNEPLLFFHHFDF